MKLILVTYSMLTAAILLAALASLAPGPVRAIGPALSLISLGLAVAVGLALRLFRPRIAVNERIHALWQNRALVMFVIAGVLTAFQWLVYFSEFQVPFHAKRWNAVLDVNTMLRWIGWAIYLGAIGQVFFGFSTLILKQIAARPRPVKAAPKADEQPDAAPEPGPEAKALAKPKRAPPPKKG